MRYFVCDLGPEKRVLREFTSERLAKEYQAVVATIEAIKEEEEKAAANGRPVDDDEYDCFLDYNMGRYRVMYAAGDGRTDHWQLLKDEDRLKELDDGDCVEAIDDDDYVEVPSDIDEEVALESECAGQYFNHTEEAES